MSLVHRIKENAVRYKTIMPRYIQLEVSKLCNLNCLGCYRQDNTSCADLDGDKNLTLDAMKDIIKMIPTANTVTFLGDGEPLMNKELSGILKYLTSIGKNLWLTTNGTLITTGKIKEWEAYNLEELHISIDSVRRDVFEKIRAGASYSQVMHMLRVAGWSYIPTYINFVAFQETIQDMPDIMRLAAGTHCKGVNMLFPIFMLGSDVKGDLTRVIDNDKNRAYLDKAADIAKRNNTKLIGGIPKLSPYFRHCNFPFALPYITLNGDVYGCCYAVGAGRTEWYQGIPKKVNSSDYLMGNIYKTPFRDIWLGDAYKELRRMVKRTEVVRGFRLLPQALLQLRSVDDNERFSYCKTCLWRWGVAC